MRQILLILVLNLLKCLGQQVTVNQDKKLVVLKVEESVRLHCEHSDRTGTYTMLWYQQLSGKGLELMGLSASVNDYTMEAKFKDMWSLERPDAKGSVLKRDKATSQDSAVYFCASSEGTGTSAAHFGAGTVVSILGENEKQKPPSISIYRPSKRELEVQNFISLVCVASNFFPEHVKIRWFVNYAERINLYEPVPQRMSNNSAYSTSKRLTLTREEYFNPDSRFRCNAAFLDGNYSVSEEIKGETDCGISNESYTMYINQGKISYIMVLCKSGLYALVVLVLVWRKKVVASSY